jgi:CelD/BcsL family acetyltransferase involved in cellulose biosynthesis
MKTKIIIENEGFDSIENEWKTLAEHSAEHIYQTYEWNRTWWKYFGKERSLYLIVFYSEDKLVGVAPLFRDTIRIIGRKIYSSIRFIGSNVSQSPGEPLIGLVAYTDYLDILVHPGYKDQVARSLADHLKDESLAYDEILFEEVPENSILRTHLIEALKETEMHVYVSEDSSCANILLDTSWKAHLKGMSRNSRKKMKGYLKSIQNPEKKLFDLREIKKADDFPEAFEMLARVHQDQWNRRGAPGMFYTSRMYDFMKETSDQFFKNGWLQIRILTPAEKSDSCVAIDLFYMYKNRIYSIIGGMDYESPLSSKGAGNVIFAVTLKEAVENGYRVFDYIRGMQDYKLRKADQVTTNQKIIVYPREPGKKQEIVAFIKKTIQIQRRMRVEKIQLVIFFRRNGIFKGIREYINFLAERISAKMNPHRNKEVKWM